MDTTTLRKLLGTPETRRETLSVLCELAALGDEGLQEACAQLAQTERDTLTRAALRGVASGEGEGEARALTMRVEEALEFVEQLEALLTDMELSLPLRRDLSGPERLRRERLIKGGRGWARRAQRKRDDRVLAILAEGSKRLGELVLTSPERWFDEGVGLLLGDLSGLAGAVRVDVERLAVEEVVSASRYPGLLGALWRGVEGREARWGDQVCRQRLEGRVSAEALEVAVAVARRVGLSETRRVAGMEFEMVWCPAGEFWMGSEEGVGRHDEHPRHRVKISQPFLMGQTQVTQALWEKVMGGVWRSPLGGDPLPRQPVVMINWYDAVRFCNALSGLDNLQPVYGIGTGDRPSVSLDPTANGYRLPTEAEWEYAAKAGTELEYAGSDTLDAVAWHNGNSSGQTHPVGEKQANAWGLYDMTGNVWEWCADQWTGSDGQTDNYSDRDRRQGVSQTTARMRRGGGWCSDADTSRIAYRGSDSAYQRSFALGMRVVAKL
jgi:formylglycine-generating enzyme required for sulfatase activity